MSALRHVMKIGPLATGEGSAYAYVAFGEDKIELAVEGSDAKGLAALRLKCGAASLVCEPALARAAAVQGLPTVELPRRLRENKAALSVTFEHGETLERIGPELVLELIDATVAFEVAEPWTVFDPEVPLAIRLDSGRVLEGCVLGASGDELGLALYHQPGSVARLQAFLAEGRPAAAPALSCTTVLLSSDAFSAAVVADVTGVAVAPRVLHIDRGAPRAAGAGDIALTIAGLRAVTELAEGRTPRGETHASAHRVVAYAALATAAPPAALYARVGRNEPCPCGSGKKFKRCHADAAAAAPAPVAVASPEPSHARDDRVTSEILAYGKRRFDGDGLDRGLRDTLGTVPLMAQLAVPVLAYMVPFDGAPLAAHYARSRGAGLPAADRAWIDLQIATSLSVWEILRVEPDLGVDIVDLLTGTRCFVHEIKGSRTLLPRDAVLARVVRDDRVVFCELHERSLDPENADVVVSRFAEAAAGQSASLRLVALWAEQVAQSDRKASTPTTVRNTDGHAAATIEDRFALDRGSFEVVLARLIALEGAHVDEHDRTGARLTFTRPGNAMHPRWANTIIGTARLTSTRLLVETNSAERAEDLVARLRDALSERATWKKRTHAPFPEMLGGRDIAIDGQRFTTPPREALQDAYRDWIDHPTPMLGGRTPREAIGDDEGRRLVHLILKQQEHHHAREPVDGLDPARLRRELALDELGRPVANLPDATLARAMGSGRKLSETILDFAQPLLEGVPQDEAHLRDALGFAIDVWNSVVADTYGGGPPDLAAIRSGLASHALRPWLAPLTARKRAQFGDDQRYVGNWAVQRQRGRFDISMETRIPQALASRLEAAGPR